MSPQRTSPKSTASTIPAEVTVTTTGADAKAAARLARLHRIEDAAKDLKAVWLGSAFYDRQDQALAEALIDALDS